MTDRNQPLGLSELKEYGRVYDSAVRATNTFRKELHQAVIKLGRQGHSVEVLAQESGLPIRVVQRVLDDEQGRETGK